MSEFDDAEIVSDVAINHVVSEVAGNPHRLELIVKESGLEKTKAEVILGKFKNFFELASEWERKARTIVVTDASQEFEIQQARAGRLLLRKKRLEVESARKELKEQALREGKAIDGIANVLKALIEPIEEYLDRQERFVEIQDARRKEIERIEAEKKAQEDEQKRIAEEAAERERIRLENERFKKEAFERERLRQEEFAASQKKLEEQRQKAESEKKAFEEKARQEHIAAEKKAAQEKADADKKLAAERAEYDRKLEAERAKAKAEKEVADKKASEEKKKLEEAARIEREKQAEESRKKIEAEKKKAADALAEAERLRSMLVCPKCGHKFNKEK